MGVGIEGGHAESRNVGFGRVLVTGGLGFLGRHVVAECRRRGSFVRILDSDGGLCPFGGDAGVECRRGSVEDRGALASAVNGMDAVFHLAGTVGVRRVARDPLGVYERHVAGARAVVEMCQEYRVSLLFASSSEVYGAGPPGVQFAESDPPGFDPRRIRFDGRAAYAASKWEGEQVCREAIRQGLRATVVRPFNAVGPGQSPETGALVPTVVAAALRDAPILLEANGEPTRSFTDARDMARAFVELAAGGRAVGAIVNVGSENVSSVREIATRIVRWTGSNSELRDGGPSLVDGVAPVLHRAPDLTQLRRLLGWVPSRTLTPAMVRGIGAAIGRRGSASRQRVHAT